MTQTPNGAGPVSATGVIQEVASFFRVSERTVWRWVKDGRLACWRDGRNVVFGEESVIALRVAYTVHAKELGLRLKPAGAPREIAQREWRAHLQLQQEQSAELQLLSQRVSRLEERAGTGLRTMAEISAEADP